MARQAIIQRELKRERTVAKYAKKRAELKSILRDPKVSDEEWEKARIKFQKLPRNASPSRLVNRCSLTGRPRGVYSFFKLGRTKLRENAHEGNLPGMRKSSW